MNYEVAVIGRGMIGAAAAKHLAEAGTSTVLIGPDEPVDRLSSNGPFSSHPDEGRITRIFGRTHVWAKVAAASIERYCDIEARSGIGFYSNSGVVAAIENAHDWVDAASGSDSDAAMVSADWLRAEMGIAAPSDSKIAYEATPGGHINPRRLVAAQTRLASMAGCALVDQAATKIEQIGGTSEGFAVSGPWGDVKARKVLVATGAFGQELLGRRLAVERRARTTLMTEVAEDVNVPCLIASGPDDRLAGIYWVPPVRYPDGRLCIKIGGDMVGARSLDPAELVGWFHGDGDLDEVEGLDASLRSLLPDVDFGSQTHSPCVISATPSGYPYIGWVDEGLAVAVGGNGSAAKSSDELGRLASSLFSDAGWTGDLDQSLFEPMFVT